MDVYGETSAILFERDTNISAPDVNPDLSGIQAWFRTDDPDALISIDFSGEGSEYFQDTHGMVTIVSAMIDDMDITDDLQSNQAGNVFLVGASGLDLGEYTLSVTAMDEVGNTNSPAFTARIIISEVVACGPGLPGCAGPTISMSVASAGIRVRINSPIPTTATFSRPVSGFTINNISVVNGTAGNFVGNDGDRVYSFDVAPTAIGDVTVDIPAGVTEDSDGNGNSAALQLSLGIPYDDDGDGAINRAEVITAIGDYLFSGLLTRDQVIAIISLYLFG